MSERDEAPTASAPPAEQDPASSGDAPRRSRWRRQYSPEEIEAAKQQWRDMRPWDSPMARADKVLIGCMVGAFVLAMATLPLRPFLLASHPTALAAVTGSSSAIGAGSAFARIATRAEPTSSVFELPAATFTRPPWNPRAHASDADSNHTPSTPGCSRPRSRESHV